MKESVCAIIVTYNFEDDFEVNLRKTYSQVNKVIIVDNNSNNQCKGVLARLEYLENVQIIYNTDNLGIATALNIGIQKIDLANYSWILTLDQDSILDDNMIENMLSAIKNKKVGLICPNLYDLNIGNLLFPQDEKEKYISKCIQSGALFNTKVFDCIGLFNDDLFMYYVDDEFCERLIKNGYLILRVTSAILFHKDGNISRKRVFKKEFDFNKRSVLATYYRARNGIYMFKNYGNIYLKDLLRDPIKIVLYDNNRFDSLKFYFKGIRDGLLGKFGKYS